MTTKRQVLDLLTAAELRDIADAHDLAVGDKRVHAQLVDAVAAPHPRSTNPLCRVRMGTVRAVENA